MTQNDKSRQKPSEAPDEMQESQKDDVGTQMNLRAEETEPFNSESEGGQESTTGMDYATRQSSIVGQGGRGKEAESRGGDADHKGSTAQNGGDETKETSVNEFTQAPEGDNATKVTKSVYGEGAVRKDDELIDPEKRLEDHPGAFQLKEKSVDEEETSEEE